jgi:hypothetical protein
MALFNLDDAQRVPNNDSADTFDAEPIVNLDNLTLPQLLDLRNEIEQRLPAKNLRDLNLERELVLQLLSSQALQSRVLQDTTIAANQQAQVSNSTAAVLSQLIKLQSEVHTSERLKRIENKLIECLNTLPKETQEAFLGVYEAILGDDSGD